MSSAADKTALRKAMLAARQQLDAQRCTLASQALCARLRELEPLRDARCIASYAAFRNEIDPALFIAEMQQNGARIALPRMEAGSSLSLRLVEPGTRLHRSELGIAEPERDSPRFDARELDAILVPALAVDAAGRRLGFGRGFYDRLLPTLPHALKVAVVHDFQLLDAVPCEDHDVAVDMVATDARTLHVAPA